MSSQTNRLRSLYSCDVIIHTNDVLAAENLTIKGGVCIALFQSFRMLDHFTEKTKWVDEEQMESFVHEYNRSSDKEQFLRDRHNQLDVIRMVHVIYFLPPSIFLIDFQ